jgi:DNA modification methylase
MVSSKGSESKSIASPCVRSETTRLVVVYHSIDQLRPNPANPRQHNQKQIQQIAKSIETFGFNLPVLVDRELTVIAGHGRLQAAKVLSMDEVPTISIDHLSQTQAAALMIADNRLTELSQWDNKLLAEQLKLLSEAELDFRVEVTGFEVAEVDVLIEGLMPAPAGGSDPADRIPETGAGVRVTRDGDLWLLDRHRVLCGNSLNQSTFSTLMEGRKATMIFVDPPYNVAISGHATGLGAIQHKNFKMASGEMTEAEFTDFLAQACGLLASHSEPGSIHFVCSDWRHMREMLDAGRQAYSELKNVCVWTKTNGGMGSFYRSQHELVFVFKLGKDAHRNNFRLGEYGRYRTNVWEYPGANSFSRTTDEGNLLELHPTVKPVALVADAIMDCSARNEIVLDSFLGSGTTVIGAERTGRICYGIELDAAYVDTVIRRWQSFTGKTAIHGVSGRSFMALEETEANELRS